MGKSDVLGYKSGNIYETRKNRGNVTMEDLQELTNALSNGTISPTPYDLLFPTIGGSQPPPKTLITIISGTGEAIGKFGRYIYSVHPNKSPLKFWRNWSVDVSRDCPILGGYNVLAQEQVKLRTSNFVRIFIASQHQLEEKPIKNFGKSSRGHSQGLTHIQVASRGHLCDSSDFLLTVIPV